MACTTLRLARSLASTTHSRYPLLHVEVDVVYPPRQVAYVARGDEVATCCSRSQTLEGPGGLT
jgi:hypothetical protein